MSSRKLVPSAAVAVSVPPAVPIVADAVCAVSATGCACTGAASFLGGAFSIARCDPAHRGRAPSGHTTTNHAPDGSFAGTFTTTR